MEVAPPMEPLEIAGEDGVSSTWQPDPNEPRYCLCNDVSYGDMVGCDNEDVSSLLLLPSCDNIITVKTIFFACPLFCEFRDLGEFAKIPDVNMLLFSGCLVQQAKNVNIKGAKII